MNKKYELIREDSIEVGGRTLYRIKAIFDFGRIKAGSKGGYVESEKNLSHDGLCWIYDNAKVYENAVVSDNARIYNKAEVFGNAQICGNVYASPVLKDKAKVYGDAVVCFGVKLSGKAQVYDNAFVSGRITISDNAKIYEHAKILDSATISGNAEIYGNAELDKNITVSDHAKIHGNVTVKSGFITIGESVEIHGDIVLKGDPVFRTNAVIASEDDYKIFMLPKIDGGSVEFTYTKSNDRWSNRGYNFTTKELIASAYAFNDKFGKIYELYISLFLEESSN